MTNRSHEGIDLWKTTQYKALTEDNAKNLIIWMHFLEYWEVHIKPTNYTNVNENFEIHQKLT